MPAPIRWKLCARFLLSSGQFAGRLALQPPSGLRVDLQVRSQDHVFSPAFAILNYGIPACTCSGLSSRRSRSLWNANLIVCTSYVRRLPRILFVRLASDGHCERRSRSVLAVCLWFYASRVACRIATASIHSDSTSGQPRSDTNRSCRTPSSVSPQTFCIFVSAQRGVHRASTYLWHRRVVAARQIRL